ncbi:hypothetical protein ACH495_10710 [Micromonospora sp. NPDC018662]|uniref:hypothetical protein n=1 Tax=Micromonospora sp. NPDC018662 TaxID=3364238 RepID=UPI00378D501D
MTWTLLHLRSRRVPLALVVALGSGAAVWTLWLVFSDERNASPLVVVMTVTLMVAVLAPTLAGPDESLDRTASMRWPRRRARHLLAGLAVVLLALLATRHTGARFGSAALVTATLTLGGLVAYSLVGPARRGPLG